MLFKSLSRFGALILTRRKSEFVVVTIPPCSEEQRLYIAVTDIRSTTVRLAFSANPSIRVVRSEHLDDAGDPIPAAA